MRHWATNLIGRPWAPDATGPVCYSCWGLVRHVFKTRHGINMPVIQVAEAAVTSENVASIKRASEDSGWRLAELPALEDDIILMRNKRGDRHVGVVVRANKRLGVLHADGRMTPTGPVGSVVWQSLADATAGGYHDFEVWRRA